MAYWLLKTEPEDCSWDDQVKAGARARPGPACATSPPRGHLKEMKKGDRAFFYHTGDEKQIVGIVEVIREHYPDPTAKKGEPWVVVDVKAVEPLPKPVTLADDQGRQPKLKDMALVKYGRLSVQPVTPDEWKPICKMGGMKG